MLDRLQNFWDSLVTRLLGPSVTTQLHFLPLTAAEQRELVDYLLLATIQILLIILVMRPLERWKPVEHWHEGDLTRIDRLYTLLKLWVVVPCFSYLLFPALGNQLGWNADGGPAPLQLDKIIPGIKEQPIVQFLIYFALYDLIYYFIHRLQHALPWWWGLHSLHHSQRQLSCWSNDRDHYLDDLLEVIIIGGVAMLIGIAPTEYASLVLLGNLTEKFSHANVRIQFGRYVDKVLVSPAFHRLHHMRADPSRPNLHHCNFALVFPIWDIIFGTALYNEPPRPCGVDDPSVDADNDKGLIAQQLAGLHRFFAGLPIRRFHQDNTQ